MRLFSAGVPNAAAGGAFTPTDIASLYGGWEADSYSGSDGDLVATWPELLGAHDATAAGSERPTFKTGIFGSQPAMRYSGAQRMVAGSWSSRSQPNTIIYCGKQTTGTEGRFCDFTGTGDRHLFQSYSGNNNIEILAGAVLSGGTYTTTLQIVVAVFNGSSSKIYQAGGAAKNTGNAGTEAAGSFVIGGSTGASGWYSGDMAAIYFFDDALALTDLNDMGDYLASKYGPTWTTAT